MYDKVKDKEI
jgi:hypothetical protein